MADVLSNLQNSTHQPMLIKHSHTLAESLPSNGVIVCGVCSVKVRQLMNLVNS